MTARRGTAITSTAAATAVAVVVAASGWSGSAKRARGVVEDCSTRSEALFLFSGAFTGPPNLVVGPLALVGAGGTPGFVLFEGAGATPAFSRGFGGNKFPLLVRNGHRVTVELSPRTRKVAGLAYGPLPEGLVRLRAAHRVVTFIACRRGERSGSSADGRPVTFWSGGVLASSPRCVPLRVWIDDAPSPRRAVIRLGVRRCA